MASNQAIISISLLTSPISHSYCSSLLQDATSQNSGAVSSFLGITRNNFEGKAVKELEYEAYEKMAVKQLNDLANQAILLCPSILYLSLHHRLGTVAAGEISVVCVASSPHRKDAMNAVDFMVEGLKSEKVGVCLWKKEVYCDDQAAWKENVADALL